MLQEGVDFEILGRNKTRKLKIYPIKLGVLFEIASIINTMTKIDVDKKSDLFDIGIETICHNKDKMLEITALAIINSQKSPVRSIKKWFLVRYLDRNLDPNELLTLIQLVTTQMDVTNFLASFVSIKKMNILEATKDQDSQTTGK